MFKKTFLVLFLIFSFSINAQNNVASGLAFLKLGADARTVALSDFGAVSVKNVASLFYNPAFLSGSENYVAFTHNNYVQDVSAENTGVTFRLLGLPLGISLNTTSINDIEIRTRPGEAEGTFNVHYFSAAVSSAFDITKFLSVGVTGKYLFEWMLSDEAYGFAFDVGAKYSLPVRNLTLGAVLRNVGKMNNLRKVASDIPTDLSGGLEYLLPVKSINSSISLIAGARKYLKESKIHFNLAAEAVYNKRFSFRFGYVTNYDAKNISAGLGFVWKSFSVDYAFVPYDYGLGVVHLLTVKANISKLF